jgi:hypothetical protein
MGAYSTTSGLLLMAGRGLATLVGGQVDIVLFLSIVASFYVFAGLIALRKLREPAPGTAHTIETEPIESAA